MVVLVVDTIVLDVLEFVTASFPFDIIGEVLGFGFGVTFPLPPLPPPKVNFDIDPVGSNAGALLESVDVEATILA